MLLSRIISPVTSQREQPTWQKGDLLLTYIAEAQSQDGGSPDRMKNRYHLIYRGVQTLHEKTRSVAPPPICYRPPAPSGRLTTSRTIAAHPPVAGYHGLTTFNLRGWTDAGLIQAARTRRGAGRLSTVFLDPAHWQAAEKMIRA